MKQEKNRLSALENEAGWALVEQSRSADSDERRAALQSLLDQNIPSLRLYLTYQLQLKPEMVDDLLQQFVLEKVLTSQLLAGADRQRGGFRSLLRVALRNFVLDYWRRSNADKRISDRAGRLTEEAAEALSDNSPQQTDLSDVAHAWQVLIKTLNRVRAECMAESRPDLWGVFEGRVLKTAAIGGQPTGLDELANRFGYASKFEVSNALVTMHRKLNRALRQVLAQHVPSNEVENELDELHQILSASNVWQPALAELGDWLPASIAMSTTLPPYNVAQLSEALRFGASEDGAFGPDVLANSLRQVLNTPRRQLWNRNRGADVSANSSDNLDTATVGDLLIDPAPSIFDLMQLKEFGKHAVARPNLALPQAVCTLLYYAAIIVAGVRLQTQISTLGNEALLHGIDWLHQQSWLDRATRKLLVEGRKWLGNLDESY